MADERIHIDWDSLTQPLREACEEAIQKIDTFATFTEMTMNADYLPPAYAGWDHDHGFTQREASTVNTEDITPETMAAIRQEYLDAVEADKVAERATSKDDIVLGVWFAKARNHAELMTDPGPHAKAAKAILAEWERRAAKLYPCYLADLEFGVCSDDLTDVFYGAEKPVTLCGKHAQSNLQDAFFLLRYDK